MCLQLVTTKKEPSILTVQTKYTSSSCKEICKPHLQHTKACSWQLSNGVDATRWELKSILLFANNPKNGQKSFSLYVHLRYRNLDLHLGNVDDFCRRRPLIQMSFYIPQVVQTYFLTKSFQDRFKRSWLLDCFNWLTRTCHESYN